MQAVGLNNLLPVQATHTNMDFTVEGLPNDRPGREPFAEHRTVNAGFFEALGIRMVSGRSFTEAENRAGSGVVVISRKAANLYWPGQDPVGKRLAYGTRPNPDRWMTIVGVAADIASGRVGQQPQAILYAPYRDFDFPIQSVSLVVRTSAAPAASANAVRAAVRELDDDVALYWVSTMEEVIAGSTTGTRFMAVLLGAFGGLAVLLAVIGVYGVMSYMVTLRHREIGVRHGHGCVARRGASLRIRRTAPAGRSSAWDRRPVGSQHGLRAALVPHRDCARRHRNRCGGCGAARAGRARGERDPRVPRRERGSGGSPATRVSATRPAEGPAPVV